MSRIRDIANILSASNSLATDTEVSSAVSSSVSTHATAANGHIGRGTTGNRPASPSIGDTYFDTTLASLISYKSGGWEKVSQDPAPQIASISPSTAATTGTTITITGASFKTGLAVQFIGADATVYNSPAATFVGGTTVTATTPTLSVANEPYDVKVINSDNQFAILENSLDAGGSPTWNTASGTITTITEQTALSTSVSATDPDGTSIVYSSSNLPTATPAPVSFAVTNSGSGAYLVDGVSNGAITLTRGGTYTFNVNASGHPFYIQTTGNGYNSYNVYSSGVTGAGAQVGTVTFVVPSNAPSTLYYQCQYHSGMYGQINIISATPWITLNSSTGALTGTAPDVASNTTYSFNVTASDGLNTSSRAFNVIVNAIISFNADFLVVAGGGGGGNSGGGAGGLLAHTNQTLTSGTTYSVAIGGGGSVGGYDGSAWYDGSNGTNSQFASLTASVGGGRGRKQDNVFNGGNGGSGGGGSYGGTGGTPTSGQGYGGGAGVQDGQRGCGGGGGAGGVGGTGTSATGGAGGNGLDTYSSWGSATSAGENISGTYWFAGGGGGGSFGSGTGAGVVGAGGNGGGGDAFISASQDGNGEPGIINTGGGGGGGKTDGSVPAHSGGLGGSGIAIMRLAGSVTAASTTGSPTRYETGGYTYYKFTGTGSITF